MKEALEILALTTMSLTSCLMLASVTDTQESTTNAAEAGVATAPASSDFQAQLKEAQQPARPEVENQRKKQ